MSKLFPSIKYTIYSSIIDDLDDWITEINGDVFIFNDDEEEELVAKCRHFFVDIDGCGYSAEDILDIRGETAPFITMYEEGTASFTDNITNMFNGDLWNSNILIIDRVEILPAYRGCGLAKSIIKDAIRLFSPRTDLIALKAFPLQQEYKKSKHRPKKWERMMKLKNREKNKIKATEALESFYSILGFVSIGRDGIMVMSNE